MKISSEPDSHPLADLPRDLTSHLSNDGGSLPQLRGFHPRTADLSRCVDLTDIYPPISSQFELIVLLNPRARLSRRALESTDSLPGSGVHAGYLGASLLIYCLIYLDTVLKMGDVNLALLQEALAESRAGRKFAWDRAVPEMKEEGLSASEITKRFDRETAEAKRFAYAVAKEIKDEQD